LTNSVLNGPVVTSIAILFGTLVATTISRLVDRNINIRKTLVTITEQVRMAQLLVNSFPEPYQGEGRKLLESYMSKMCHHVVSDSVTIATMRSITEADQLVLMLHKMAKDKSFDNDGLAIAEAYGVMGDLAVHRAELIAAIQTKLPRYHYANLATLAMSICLIFLAESDPNLVNFSAGPQLAFAWAILIGTFSMLAIVIYDLSSPLVGIMRVSPLNKASVVSFAIFSNDRFHRVILDCLHVKS